MEKILVIQTAFIGDAILTLPMIQKLKEKYPQSEIDVLAIPVTGEIFSASPFVNDVILIDKRGKHKSFFSLIKFINQIKKNNYSIIYSPHKSFRSSFIVMKLGVKETYGFTNSSFKHVYRYLIDYKSTNHEVQRNLDLINFNYTGSNWHITPIVNITASQQEKINAFISSNKLNKKIAAVAPGSVWNTKKYPSVYFEEIIKYFLDNNFDVLLIGSEKEKLLCEDIKHKFTNGIFNTAGMFSITETIELLKRTEILVSNDSAPTHFGMCADIAVITIYCSTVPEFGFFPFNKKSSYVSLHDLSCKPCGLHGYNECPVKNFACGKNLKPEIVISKIREIINDKS